MGKLFGVDYQTECPQCKGTMRVRDRTPYQARQACEKQTIECANCGYSAKWIVDAYGRPLQRAVPVSATTSC